MTIELDVLRRVSEGLSARDVPFMLTGSFALAHYVTPRMTRDLDIVVASNTTNVGSVLAEFSTDFYVDADAVREAVRSESMFNMMHLNSAIKIDVIVRKSSAYRLAEFGRRQPVRMGPVRTWIVSREDLILSKLAWARESRSELQLRDVRLLLTAPVDVTYMRQWAPTLSVAELLNEVMP